MSKRDPICRERQDGLYVEFFDRLGVVVDLRERQVLAQVIALPLIARQVDQGKECRRRCSEQGSRIGIFALVDGRRAATFLILEMCGSWGLQ